MAYTRPQTLVYQDRENLPSEEVRRMNAFIYGPHYSLFRYSDSDEKAIIGVGAYDKNNPKTYAYPGKPGNGQVDLDYNKLYAENIWLKYFISGNPATNPIIVISPSESNVLTAADRVLDGGNKLDSGVTYTVGGYHYGAIKAPEAYYFTPDDRFDLGTVAGIFNYITTENYEGQTNVPADATQAGVETQGPNGIVFDLDNANTVNPPYVFRIQDAPASANYFEISVKTTELKQVIDMAINTPSLKLDLAETGALSATWTPATGTLAITINEGVDDLDAVRAAVVAAACPFVDVGEVNGNGAVMVDLSDTENQFSEALGAPSTTEFVSDCFKVLIYDSTYIWKTANGYSRMPALFRDVSIGDKVNWSAVASGTGAPVSGTTYIKELIADRTLPIINPAEADDANSGSQSATNLIAGAALLSSGNPDNQNEFDYVNSLVHSNDTDNKLDPDLYNKVLSQQLTITVTKAGTKGSAQVSVINAAGTYARYAVPVEDNGNASATYAGSIYLGMGLYVDVIATSSAAGDLYFNKADSYLAGPVASAFTAVAPPAVTGVYSGLDDTIYKIEITRGGVFTRSVEVVDGIQIPPVLTLEASIAGWTAGDVDDEYVFECISAGTPTTAVWKLTSQRGDNVPETTFSGVGGANAIPVGASGLVLNLATGTTADVINLGDVFIIKVKAARPQAVITDSSGADQETTQNIYEGVPFNVGLYGITATFPANANGGLIKGDVFSIKAEASKDAAVHTIVLADNLPEEILTGLNADGTANISPDTVDIELMLKESSLEIPKENRNPSSAPGSFNWTSDAGGLTTNPDMTITSPQWVDPSGDYPYLPVDGAELFINYRALIPDYSDGIYSMTDSSEVSELGPAVEDNPLALAMTQALANNGGVTVYFTSLVSDDLAGDQAALARASLTDLPYTMCPVNTDPERIAAMQASVNATSTPEKKLWRMGVFGREAEVGKDVVSAATHPSGNTYQATVSDDTRIPGIQYTKVEFSENAELLANVKPGDTVKLNFVTDPWGNYIHTERTVAEITSNTVLYLVSGLDAEIVTPRKTEVYHEYSIQETAQAEYELSRSYSDERLVRVFPNRLGISGTYVGSEFGAAAIAGAIGSVVPQQGLTNMTISGFDDLPDIYNKYDSDQLDLIASGGTLILAQDIQGSEIYVRHQLTTNYTEGDLDVSEIMSVKNLDAVSYYLADIIKPFIGKYNATSDMARVVETQLVDGLAYLGGGEYGLLGPMLIMENGETNVESVQVHPTLKDRILAICRIQRPYSLNVVELHIIG